MDAEPVHIANVAPVLQRRPAVFARSNARTWVCEEGRPWLRCFATEPADVLGREVRRVEATFVTTAFEHPRPTLRLGFDRHAPQRM
jgi:hypothetical protein